MAGHLNGSGTRSDDGKVASLDEARKRAAERAKRDKIGVGGATSRGAPMSARDWLIGSVVVLMALGMLWHWLAPLMGAKGLVR